VRTPHSWIAKTERIKPIHYRSAWSWQNGAVPAAPEDTPLRIAYPPELPISARRAEIARAIAAHQVVIVSGETGSGKTTQIPKILLETGYGGGASARLPALRHGRRQMIAHTQPRRIAARATAERVAHELGTELGQAVGYQIRFTDHSSSQTRLKVMTDGVLLAQIQRDPELRAYDAIIIDEAHERSLNIDFLLGYLSNLLPRRPDLKLIITSATIDSDLFAAHFGPDREHPAPVIEVSGRTYPVEIRYRPLGQDGVPEDQPTAIVAAARELLRQGNGDILVFCSGEREIRDAADALSGTSAPKTSRPAKAPVARTKLALGQAALRIRPREPLWKSSRSIPASAQPTNTAFSRRTQPGGSYWPRMWPKRH
jgi:ATP-dependent helicase HrpA